MLRKYTVVLVVFFCCLLPASLASKQDFNFRHFNITDGLSNNTVKCITQDEQGFVWFGTFNGLCRFDGVDFLVYTHRSDDRSSIVNNSISALLSTKGGIWVGTEKGLDFFSLKENRFYHSRQILSSGKDTMMNQAIKSIIATENQVFVLNTLGELSVRNEGHDFVLCDYNISGHLFSICAYKDGLILAQSSEALYLIDTYTRTIVSELSCRLTHWSDKIYYSKNTHLIFVGYGMGYSTDVFTINANNQIEKVKMDVPTDVKTVIDYNNATLFGTDGKGLIAYQQDEMHSYAPQNSNISSDAVHSLYVDRDNNLWIGTYRGGVNLYSANYEWFQVLSEENGQFTHKIVTAVVADNQLLYVGLDGGGLNVYDKVSGKVSVYNSKNSKIGGDNILSMLFEDGCVWMGIYGKGLCRFSPSSGTFKTYPLPAINGELNPNCIWEISSDGEGNIWLVGRGIYVFNVKTETFTTVSAFADVYTSGIVFDEDDVWLSSTITGLYKLDKKSREKILHYSSTSGDMPLVSDDIRFLYKDSNNNIWFSAQYEGLFKLDRKKNSIISYGSKDGLTDQNVASMMEDKNGYFWVGTMNGFFRFNPQTETFICFGKEDNLPSTQFNYNACFQQGDVMYFGTTNGLVCFEPERIEYKHTHQQVYFAKFQSLNKDKTIYLSGDNHQEISLPYNKNFFTISFSVPELVSPDKIYFSCYMQDFEPDWRDISHDRQVVYTNVPPGRYVFCVRTTDSEGQWSPHVSCLNIVITPPWWRTSWAYSLWFFLLSGMLFLLFLFYRREVNIKQLVRMKEMEKSVNEQKLRFFTNISHEFRTPLTLILSPLEALIKNEKDDLLRSKLSKIHKNAKDLLSLVNQLLDFRKLEMKGETLRLGYGDLVEFMDIVFQTFEEVALSEQKDLSLSVKVEHLYMSFDKDKVRKILNNLLSNAFKYTVAGAQIRLSLDRTTLGERDYALIQVSDTGKGIPSDRLPHIFERFYQVESAKDNALGSGIGLHLVKEYINLHEGKIEVDSTIDKGSIFSVFLPLDLKAEGISDMSDAMKTEPFLSLSFEQKMKDDANKTILIVEDNDEFRQFLVEQLERDYQIVSATNGEEGEQQALRQLPDLIISDIMMPKVSGVEFCHRMKTNIQTSHIPVILLTARASDDFKLSGYEAGADEYISKPFNLDILLLRIQKLIEQQEERKKYFRKAIKVNPSEITTTSIDEELIQRVLSLVEKNMRNAEYLVDDLSKDIGMCRTNLYNKIQSITGMTPAQFFRSVRLKRAAQLLKDTQLNVSEVADEVGFSTIKYFNIHFKEEFEFTPTQYRQRVKKGL